MIFRATTSVNSARVVVFRQSPRDGTWCVGETSDALLCGDVRSLGASRDCRMILFNAVLSGEDQLGQASTWAVQIHGLQRLVGEESKWLNGDAVYGLVVLATRGIEGVRVLNPLLIDKREQWELSVNRVCASSAKSLLVPWNERDGHWSLLCLDLVNLTAVCCNSLDQPISAMMRQFCRQAFGKRWRSTVQKFDSPLQDDGHNCGVFVVFNAFHLARGQPMPDIYEVSARTRAVWHVLGCLTNRVTTSLI